MVFILFVSLIFVLMGCQVEVEAESTVIPTTVDIEETFPPIAVSTVTEIPTVILTNTPVATEMPTLPPTPVATETQIPTATAEKVEVIPAFPVVDRGDGESISRLVSTEVPNPSDVWFRPAYHNITKGNFPDEVDTSLFASEAEFKAIAEANGINVAGTSWILDPNEGDVGPVTDKRLYTVAKVVGYGEATNKSGTFTGPVTYFQMYGIDTNGNPFSFVQETPLDNTTCQGLTGVDGGNPSYPLVGVGGDCSVARFSQEDPAFVVAGYYLGGNGWTYDSDSVSVPANAPHADAVQTLMDVLTNGGSFLDNTETGKPPLADLIILE